MFQLSSFWKDLIDLCYLPVCTICQEPYERQRLGECADGANTFMCCTCYAELKIWAQHMPTDRLYEVLSQRAQATFWEEEWKKKHIFSSSYMVFEKKGGSQQLIHTLKYKGQPALGTWLGKKCGKLVWAQQFTDHFDGIVPIPLHWKKKFSRGFNQSIPIAKGVSAATGIPVWDVMTCKQYVSPNSRKNQKERLNTKQPYALKALHKQAVKNSRLLLVDDVITTGNTMWQGVEVLLQGEVKGIGVLSAAAVDFTPSFPPTPIL